MKKVSLMMIAIGMFLAGFSQAVSDNAVIPVSISLNSILRLNVTSGGNIEFAFNTLDQYNNGIANTDGTDTHFTVSSSMDFNVSILAEDGTFIGADDATNTLVLDFVAYDITEDGSGAETTNWTFPAGFTDLTNAASAIVTSVATAGAGASTKNAFVINWECGTANCGSTGLLGEKADRYSTNVFLILAAQ